ncbi:uncharacterized protein SCHCODRAFT_02663698 [Schizophyllum commune H4-8]|uniref:F-box domain-containing protein n=1 Tax=Schizophyllum commune (strain H4-8 / FGSC 9210) TaxID=578458 RepID=D8PME8_SCHCM|nr:uncharacterized protein SCHCODRAFT_02663698 [Schizophyllum commune H4-8]KAI5898843.1 hypothetical protein SCHCODRAFT_02663698 [Schizophyllum commune H4-8]
MPQTLEVLDLPTEILAYILIQANFVDPDVPWVLSETCRRLRAVALSVPEAWTHVYLPPTTFNQLAPSLKSKDADDADHDSDEADSEVKTPRPLALWLERNGQRHFHLSIRLCDLPSRPDRMITVAREMRNHGSRLRGIALDGESPSVALELLAIVLERVDSLPHKPQVDVQFKADVFWSKTGPRDVVNGLEKMATAHASVINSIRLEGLVPPPGTFRDKLEDLAGLAIDTKFLQYSSIGFTNWSYGDEIPPDALALVTLPAMEYLDVWQTCPEAILLLGMHMPALRTLKLRFSIPSMFEDDRMRQVGPAFAQFVERTPHLRVVDLDSAPISKDTLCVALCSMPVLVDLGLEDILVTGGVVDALAKDAALAPNLAHLRVRKCDNVTGSSFMRLALARSWLDNEHDMTSQCHPAPLGTRKRANSTPNAQFVDYAACLRPSLAQVSGPAIMSESTMLMSLPTETLTAIVLFAVAVDMGIPWVLSETCHRLRAIVLSLPQAWTRVHLAPVTFYESKIGPPPPATEGEDADDDVDLPGLRLARPLDLWLQRMGDNPFELHIEFCDLPSRALRIGKVASEIRKTESSDIRDQADNRTVAGELENVMVGNAAVVRSLHLEGLIPPPGVSREKLDSLTLHEKMLNVEFLVKVLPRCPRLKELRTTDKRIPYRHSTHIIKQGMLSATWSDFSRARWDYGDPLQPEMLPASLTELEYLDIGIQRWVGIAFALKQLQLPALHTLKMHCYLDAELAMSGYMKHFGTDFVRFVERTPSLRTLDLNETPISKGALCDALRKMPALVELGLGDLLVTNGFVDALAQDRTLAPHLTYLRVYNCENVAGSSLAGLARARSTRSGGKLQRLDADLCKHVTNADISRIRGMLGG